MFVIVAAFLIAASLFAVRTPLWQNPDEPAHYNNIATIAAGKGLPVLHAGDYDQALLTNLIDNGFPADASLDTLRYEAYQPPLYYLVATPIYLLGHGNLLFLRLLNVGFGAIVLVLLYLCIERVFPTKPLMAVGAVAFAAFLPMQVAMSAAVNNDGLVEVLLMAAMLVLLRWMYGQFYGQGAAAPARLLAPQWSLLLLGCLLGFGMLTKIYAYMGLALCAGTVLLVVWLQPRAAEALPAAAPTRRNFGHGIVAALWVGVPAVLLVAPAWLRNVQLYGGWDIIGLRFHDTVVVGQPTTAQWISQNGWIHFIERALTFTFRSFWGVFGWLGVFMDNRTYQFLLVFTGILAFGLLWALVRFISGRPETDMDRFQFWVLGLFVVMLLAVLSSYLWYNVKFVQHQGRYLLWGLLPIACFVALGWRELMQPLQGKVTGFLIGLLAIAMGLASFFVVERDKLFVAVTLQMALLLILQPYLLSGAVDAMIIGWPYAVQRWLSHPALRMPLAALRLLAWATPFVLLFWLDLMIPLWYIGPQLGP